MPLSAAVMPWRESYRKVSRLKQLLSYHFVTFWCQLQPERLS